MYHPLVTRHMIFLSRKLLDSKQVHHDSIQKSVFFSVPKAFSFFVAYSEMIFVTTNVEKKSSFTISSSEVTAGIIESLFKSALMKTFFYQLVIGNKDMLFFIFFFVTAYTF